MDNVSDSTNEVLLVEKIRKKIMLNGKTFVIEEPSRSRLIEYMNLQKDMALEAVKGYKPIQEIGKKLDDATKHSENSDEIDALAKEFEETVRIISEKQLTLDNRNLKFLLGVEATDEFIENLGIHQKQRVVEIAEDLYGIPDLKKKGGIYFPTRGDLIGP